MLFLCLLVWGVNRLGIGFAQHRIVCKSVWQQSILEARGGALALSYPLCLVSVVHRSADWAKEDLFFFPSCHDVT